MINAPNMGGTLFHSNGFASAGHQNDATAQVDSMHGMKRLASCREELERSWQGTQLDLRCVSNSGSICSDDSLGSNSRAKRRRTLQSNCSDGSDDMMHCSLVRGTRISPFNRPPQSQASTRPQVKAGWYEGEVDALGNRHGMGVTKHDDGTEYEGPYAEDAMEGPDGRYKFIIRKHSVPNPSQNGSHLYRQIETSYKGSFKNDRPHGNGMIITKTVDTAPQVLGSMPVDVRFMEVVYDVGVHNSREDGKAVGEGVRIIYSTAYFDGTSTTKMNCFRLQNGKSTNVRLGESYAAWVFQCMGVDFPAHCR